MARRGEQPSPRHRRARWRLRTRWRARLWRRRRRLRRRLGRGRRRRRRREWRGRRRRAGRRCGRRGWRRRGRERRRRVGRRRAGRRGRRWRWGCWRRRGWWRVAKRSHPNADDDRQHDDDDATDNQAASKPWCWEPRHRPSSAVGHRCLIVCGQNAHRRHRHVGRARLRPRSAEERHGLFARVGGHGPPAQDVAHVPLEERVARPPWRNGRRHLAMERRGSETRDRRPYTHTMCRYETRLSHSHTHTSAGPASHVHHNRHSRSPSRSRRTARRGRHRRRCRLPCASSGSSFLGRIETASSR